MRTSSYAEQTRGFQALSGRAATMFRDATPNGICVKPEHLW